MIGVLSSAQNNAGSSPSPAFSPADLFSSGEDGAWYDPSDLSTLWKDTAGTTPVTSDGDAVARIDDKSGNGYHLIQPTLANRPIYKTDGSYHWLSFSGSEWMYVGHAIGSLSSSFVVAVAAKSNAASSVLALWSTQSSSTHPIDQDRITGYLDTRSSPKRLWFVDEPSIYVNLKNQLSTDVNILLCRKDGSVNGGRVNSEEMVTVSTPNIGANNEFFLGRQQAGPLLLDGQVRGVVVRDIMTEPEQADLELWLADNCGGSIP